MISNLLKFTNSNNIDMLNNLVMAGAMLCKVDFNIFADMPS